MLGVIPFSMNERRVMKTPEEILKSFPNLERHHEYCRELFIHAKQYSHDWICMCDFLKKYDVYLDNTEEQ